MQAVRIFHQVISKSVEGLLQGNRQPLQKYLDSERLDQKVKELLRLILRLCDETDSVSKRIEKVRSAIMIEEMGSARQLCNEFSQPGISGAMQEIVDMIEQKNQAEEKFINQNAFYREMMHKLEESKSVTDKDLERYYDVPEEKKLQISILSRKIEAQSEIAIDEPNIKQIKQANRQLKKRSQILEEKTMAQQKQIAERKQRISTMETELAQIEKKLNKQRQSTKQKEKIKTEEIKKMQQEMEKIMSQKSAAMEEKAKLLEENSYLEQKRVDINKKQVENLDKLKKVTEEKNNCQKKTKDLQKQLEEVKSQRASIKEQLQRMKKQAMPKENEVKQVQKQIDSLRKEYILKESQLQRMSHQLQLTEKQLQFYKQQNEEIQIDVNIFKAEAFEYHTKYQQKVQDFQVYRQKAERNESQLRLLLTSLGAQSQSRFQSQDMLELTEVSRHLSQILSRISGSEIGLQSSIAEPKRQVLIKFANKNLVMKYLTHEYSLKGQYLQTLEKSIGKIQEAEVVYNSVGLHQQGFAKIMNLKDNGLLFIAKTQEQTVVGGYSMVKKVNGKKSEERSMLFSTSSGDFQVFHLKKGKVGLVVEQQHLVFGQDELTVPCKDLVLESNFVDSSEKSLHYSGEDRLRLNFLSKGGGAREVSVSKWAVIKLMPSQ